jgi:hypothetical protein
MSMISSTPTQESHRRCFHDHRPSFNDELDRRDRLRGARVGLWGGDKQPPADEPTQSSSSGDVPEGYDTYTSPTRGYSISHPDDWEVSPDYIKIGEVGGDAFISPDIDDGFKVNVNVIREALPDGVSDDEYIETTLNTLEAQFNVDPERGEDVTVAGEQAATVAYEATSGTVSYDVTQVVVVAEGAAWILTLSTAEGKTADYLPTFETMYGSFSIE